MINEITNVSIDLQPLRVFELVLSQDERIEALHNVLVTAQVLRPDYVFTFEGCSGPEIYQDPQYLVLKQLADHCAGVRRYIGHTTDRRYFPTMVFAGIPGIGKTRAMHEYFKFAYTQQQGEEVFVPLYVTYNNLTQFSPLDVALGGSLSIAYRVLLQYLVGGSYWSVDNVNRLRQVIGAVTLSEVLAIIALHAQKYPPNCRALGEAPVVDPATAAGQVTRRPVMFVLALDEFQRSFGFPDTVLQPSPNPFFQNVFIALASAAIPATRFYHCTSLFAGLLYQPFAEVVIMSSFESNRVSLPPLTFEQSRSWLAGAVARTKATGWSASWPAGYDPVTDETVLRLLIYVSGHPSSLIALFDALLKTSPTTSAGQASIMALDLDFIRTEILHPLRDRVKDSPLQLIEKLLWCGLRSMPKVTLAVPFHYSVTPEELEQLYIGSFNNAGTLVLMSLPVVDALLQRLEKIFRDNIGKQPPFWWKALRIVVNCSFASGKSSKSFETACAAAYALRLCTFAKYWPPSEETRLSDLHAGAAFATLSKLTDMKIKLPAPESIRLVDFTGKNQALQRADANVGHICYDQLHTACVDFWTVHDTLTQVHQ
ncbi:hypothetical protein CAOG_008324, partial [Capsaspora owczarzaki ATCC 30864]